VRKGFESQPEVVVLGAGLAGMTAAHQLAGRDLVILETLDRVGGRTLSGEHGEYWYNLGAQFVWDRRTLALCRELGVDALDADGARAAAVMRGRLVEAPNPQLLFLKLPLGLGERWDLARTIAKLNAMATRMPQLDRSEVDSKSLSDLMGDVKPITKEVLDIVTESGCGLDTEEVSGWIGLGYSTHLFGGDVNGTLKQVVGGTQAISKAIAARLDPERIVLGATVGSLRVEHGRAEITYTHEDRQETLRPRAVVNALPAPAVLEVMPDLPAGKTRALRAIGEYSPVVATAWLTGETRPMPWDRLLAVPVVGDHTFDQLSNNAFFIRRRHGGRHPGGTLVTLSTCSRGQALVGLADEEVRARVGADLQAFFPSAGDVLDAAEVKVKRWPALVPFRKGWLAKQAAVRAPVGPVVFCGDYTAQPGTPDAVGSGHHAARATLDLLASA
jgi:protoporphyrinogen/coproporphyrinogen III oxidase